MRKHLTSGDFKGSVFLELDSVEEAEALMAKELVHEGAKLVCTRARLPGPRGRAEHDG
jgi:hypothetical protein